MNIFWSSTICCCIPISCHTVSLFDTITSNGVHILLNSIVEAAKKNSYFAVKITGMLVLTQNLTKGPVLYRELIVGMEETIFDGKKNPLLMLF